MGRISTNQPKRKRGRPKGSKNKKTNNPSTESNTPDFTNVRSYKMLGICPACDCFICSKDLISKQVFECACGEKARISKLKSKKRNALENQGISRQEYLKQSINADYHDMPGYGPAPLMDRIEDDDED